MSNTSSALLSRQGFPTGYRTSRKEILMFAVLLQDSTYFIMYVYIFVYVFTTYVVTTYILLMKLAVKQIKTIERLTFSSTSPDCSFAFSVVCVTSLTRGDVNNRFIDRAQKVVIYPRLPILTHFSPVVQLQVWTCIWHPEFQTHQINSLVTRLTKGLSAELFESSSYLANLAYSATICYLVLFILFV